MSDPVEQFMEDVETYPGTDTPVRQSAPDIPEEGEEEAEEKDWRVGGKDYMLKGESITFYSIGALAKALGKRPVTIRSWEQKGWLPRPMFRGPHLQGEGRKRLYTEAQILKLRAIALEEGVWGPSPKALMSETKFAERALEVLDAP